MRLKERRRIQKKSFTGKETTDGAKSHKCYFRESHFFFPVEFGDNIMS